MQQGIHNGKKAKPVFDYQHILRFMDLPEENHDDYLTWLFHQSNSIVKRDTSVLYYDCANFYFETEQPDEDVVDEVTGEVIKGLRQYGPSKEHRPNPIVEMGLFMDRQGIPITMCLHPGNTNEQLTAIPPEQEVLKMIPGARFIYCAGHQIEDCFRIMKSGFNGPGQSQTA